MTNKNCVEGLAHEIWAAAQLMPSEGIEDGVERIMLILLKWQGGLQGEIKQLQGEVEDLKRGFRQW